MDTIIVVVIVALAAAWAGWRLLGRRRAAPSGCGSGCEGCSCAAKPHPVAVRPSLVSLRRRR